MTKTSRDKIVTAARELIREKGFAATSMKLVAQGDAFTFAGRMMT